MTSVCLENEVTDLQPAVTGHQSQGAGLLHHFRRASHRPWLLLGLVLLVNAVCRPYCGLVHDACLYAVQTANRLDGSFQHDLYLRYGSQDAYSAFSFLIQPLVVLLGLRVAFFITYLLANASFYLALMSLTFRLVPRRPLAAASLLYIAAIPIWFGGLHVFHANENFLTPRIMANALVLFACSQILAGRLWRSLLLIVGALMLHPLMAFSGLLLWMTVVLFTKCSRRVVFSVLALGVLGSALLLGVRPWGLAVFGEMDPTWKEAVKPGNEYAFVSEWRLEDWLGIAFAFAVVAAATASTRDRRLRIFLAALLMVGAAGVIGSWLADHLPYALLIQGQPYRGLWLVQLLAIPLAFRLMYRLWTDTRVASQLAAVGIALALGCSPLSAVWAVGLVTAVVWGRCLCLRDSGPLDHDQTRRFILRVALWTFAAVTLPTVVSATTMIIKHLQAPSYLIEPLAWYRALFLVFDPGLVLLIALGGACWLVTRVGAYRWAPQMLLAAAVAAQACFILTVHFLEQRQPLAHDVQFIRQSLPCERELTIHWPAILAKKHWFDLHVNSYFSWQQTSGSMFNRDNALEGVRRARLVAPIDLQAHQLAGWTGVDWQQRSLREIYGANRIEATPTLADLVRLCGEPELDYVISRQEIGYLHSATNGRWYLYDCQQVRLVLATRTALAAARP